jgi:hypothetical protein
VLPFKGMICPLRRSSHLAKLGMAITMLGPNLHDLASSQDNMIRVGGCCWFCGGQDWYPG